MHGDPTDLLPVDHDRDLLARSKVDARAISARRNPGWCTTRPIDQPDSRSSRQGCRWRRRAFPSPHDPRPDWNRRSPRSGRRRPRSRLDPRTPRRRPRTRARSGSGLLQSEATNGVFLGDVPAGRGDPQECCESLLARLNMRTVPAHLGHQQSFDQLDILGIANRPVFDHPIILSHRQARESRRQMRAQRDRQRSLLSQVDIGFGSCVQLSWDQLARTSSYHGPLGLTRLPSGPGMVDQSVSQCRVPETCCPAGSGAAPGCWPGIVKAPS